MVYYFKVKRIHNQEILIQISFNLASAKSRNNMLKRSTLRNVHNIVKKLFSCLCVTVSHDGSD